MFEKCPKCGRMHYRTDPCFLTEKSLEHAMMELAPVMKKSRAALKEAHVPKKSTAALTEVRERSDSDAVTTALGQSVEKGRIDVPPAAGVESRPSITQAILDHVGPTAAGQVRVTIGRPRSITPSEGKSKRAAYMRDYQRKARLLKKLNAAGVFILPEKL